MKVTRSISLAASGLSLIHISDFTLQPRVVNGASELFELAFGERGRHSRIAIGAGSLPDGASVEVDVVAYLEP